MVSSAQLDSPSLPPTPISRPFFSIKAVLTPSAPTLKARRWASAQRFSCFLPPIFRGILVLFVVDTIWRVEAFNCLWGPVTKVVD
jgi:hypothetical protein